MSANPDNDPYVCFRRREIKLQRKVRRSDTLALDKLRKLKGDMASVKEILELVKQREQTRKEILTIEHVIFEKRIHLRRLKRFLGVNTPDTLDSSPERSRKKFRQEYFGFINQIVIRQRLEYRSKMFVMLLRLRLTLIVICLMMILFDRLILRLRKRSRGNVRYKRNLDGLIVQRY
jgi:hypothetical protein